MPSHINQKRLALEAARLMVERIETEYLHAKESAILLLGLPYNTPYPTNKQIKEFIARLTKNQLGEEVMTDRVRAMRETAEELMTILIDFDPFLIGSTLSGKIRASSDIDLHVYCHHHSEIHAPPHHRRLRRHRHRVRRKSKGHLRPPPMARKQFPHRNHHPPLVPTPGSLLLFHHRPPHETRRCRRSTKTPRSTVTHDLPPTPHGNPMLSLDLSAITLVAHAIIQT